MITIKFGCPEHPHYTGLTQSDCSYCRMLSNLCGHALAISRMKNSKTPNRNILKEPCSKDFSPGLVVSPYLVKAIIVGE